MKDCSLVPIMCGFWGYITAPVSKCKCMLLPTQTISLRQLRALAHSFPMHPFSTLWKPYGFLMFSGGRERVTGNEWVKNSEVSLVQLFLRFKSIFREFDVNED